LLSPTEGAPRPQRFTEKAWYKFLVLAVVSLVCFGSYFCYDEVEAFDVQIQEDLGVGVVEFGLLYSLYSFPNWVLPFFGGLLGDKVGLRLAGFVYVILVFVGSVIVAVGPQLAVAGKVSPHAGYGIMLAGRIIFGAGSESLNVIQNAMVSLWFKSGGLALALSATLSTSRLGDYLAIVLSPILADAFGGWVSVMWIGAVLCALSLVSVLVYCVLDKAAEAVLPDREPPTPDNPLNFRAVLHFDARFWVVAVLCLAYYSGVFPFIAICNAYLTSEFGFDQNTAGWYAGTITLASMVLSPVMGRLLDVVGRRPYFIILGSCMIIPMHIYLALIPYEQMYLPIIPIIVMGLSFSIVPSALWPCIPLITADAETATAFGLLAAIQNFGLSVMNYGETALLPNATADSMAVQTAKYRHGMWFFAGMDIIGLIMGIALLIIDKRMGGTLSRGRSKAKTQEDLLPAPEHSLNA